MKTDLPARFATATLNAFFPPRCLHCHLPSHRAIDLCAGCERDLAPLTICCRRCAEPLTVDGFCGHCLSSPPAFSRIIVPYLYQPPLKSWILRFKQQGDLRAGQVLGQLLLQHLLHRQSELMMPDLLVPMPLHWRRRLSRGFNQSAELTRVLAKATDLPVSHGAVRRVKPTVHQQGLRRSARLRNLRRAFVATDNCAGHHIAVVDDVVTSASTARAVAAALASAGASSVQVWAVGRTAMEK